MGTVCLLITVKRHPAQREKAAIPEEQAAQKCCRNAAVAAKDVLDLIYMLVAANLSHGLGFCMKNLMCNTNFAFTKQGSSPFYL